ncbi:hypothetical protein [Nocardioides sp. URHA0032]|uniref:hypothetical protein n=1 Tax=Nocardioides sp. URHA0032 TaxID=1380388 RepID=UPI000490C85F|nr:hypothetical protein [Nocardioides sp. URHA0032]
MGRAVAVALLLTLPFAAALTAVGHAPPARIEVAGQPVSVRPVLGQDTSLLFDGALVSPRHRELAGIDVGVDVDANWIQIVPSDKDTRSYLVSLWANPQPAMQLIQDAARRQVVTWGAGGFAAGTAVLVGVLLVLRSRRRRLAGYTAEQAALVRGHNRRLRRVLAAGGVVLVLVVDVLGARVLLHRDHRVVTPTASFDGTALEGTEVRGLLADVLPFLSVLRPRSEFYDDVAANLEDAVRAESTLAPADGEVRFVMAEDFEDVNGMARQVGLTASLVDADFVALSGDLTFAGKDIETYVMDTVDYYAEGRPVYFAPGLHDTRTIVDAAHARGWVVADGTTRTIGGLDLLAVPDPRISTVGDFGSGTVLRDPDVDTDAFVADTVRRACEDEPDFVLLHDHLLGSTIAEAGCQRVAVLDGRSYEFLGPRPVETSDGSETTEFTVGSAGGHVSTEPDPGVIRHPARFAVLSFRPATGATTYSVVTVNPDASVSITPRLPLSVPYDAG